MRYRGLRHPEPAYYTLYRIDWVAFDRMAGAERQASAARRSVRSAMAKSSGPSPAMECVHQRTVSRPHSTSSAG